MFSSCYIFINVLSDISFCIHSILLEVSKKQDKKPPVHHPFLGFPQLNHPYGGFRKNGAIPSHHPFRTMGFSRFQKPTSELGVHPHGHGNHHIIHILLGISASEIIQPHWGIARPGSRRGVAEPWGGPDRRELLGELVRPPGQDVEPERPEQG